MSEAFHRNMQVLEKLMFSETQTTSHSRSSIYRISWTFSMEPHLEIELYALRSLHKWRCSKVVIRFMAFEDKISVRTPSRIPLYICQQIATRSFRARSSWTSRVACCPKELVWYRKVRWRTLRYSDYRSCFYKVFRRIRPLYHWNTSIWKSKTSPTQSTCFAFEKLDWHAPDWLEGQAEIFENCVAVAKEKHSGWCNRWLEMAINTTFVDRILVPPCAASGRLHLRPLVHVRFRARLHTQGRHS